MPSTVDALQAVAARADVRVVRESRIAEQVICVGGLPGCGKTMITPIVGSFSRVEIQKFNYAIEHICQLRLLGKLDDATATTMIRMLVDLDLYHMMMSRETNLRWSDLSSIFKNPGTWRYLRRLFQPGDAAAIERIRREHPMLHLTLHHVVVLGPTLLAALGEGVRLLNVVRHPYYLLKHWYVYIERYGTDARDLTIWFEHEGRALPFFARGWEEQYLQVNPMDRCILAIEQLLRREHEVLEGFTESQRAQVLTVPFEQFVLNPQPWLTRMEAFLGTSMTPATRRELKRQRVPRQRVAQGIARPIYRQYGWEPPARDSDERQELNARRAFAVGLASDKGMVTLDHLAAEYEATHWPAVAGR